MKSNRVLAVFLLLVICSCNAPWRFEQITMSGGEHAGEFVLPAGSFTVDMGSPLEVVSPFVLREELNAAGGQVLTIPEGAGSPRRTGRAVFEFKPPAAGTYYLWAHVLWRDSCGNSISVKVDNSPQYLTGQDPIYNTWHWVKAGRYSLFEGTTHRLELSEREDGVAVDQFLFTPDERFVPSAPILRSGQAKGIRRFGDDFARSPGHGMEAWDLVSGRWEIAFSLDPNRIPNQYSLVGDCSQESEPAIAFIKGPPWKGCRLEFSAMPQPGTALGAVLRAGTAKNDEIRVELFANPSEGTAHVCGRGWRAVERVPEFRPLQWYRIRIERWAWILRVLVDDRVVFQRFDLEPVPCDVGLLVTRGSAVFDDVSLAESPWQAEDAVEFKMPWMGDANALWYRAKDAPRLGTALLGRRGTIWTGMPGFSVRSVFLEAADSSQDAEPGILPPDLEKRAIGQGVYLFTRPPGSADVSRVGVGVQRSKAKLRKVAVEYDNPVPDLFQIGFYHFTTPQIEDPSDYLDFTEEEYRQIRSAPDAQKLLRRAKWKLLLGGDGAVWNPRGGTWFLRDGVLVGRGPGAVLAYWNEINSALCLRMKIRRPVADASLEIRVYAERMQGGLKLCLPDKGEHSFSETCPTLELPWPVDAAWHELEVRAGDGLFSAALDKKETKSLACERGAGSELFFKVSNGTVEIDDVELLVPRSASREFFYAFDRPETDWWREGGEWIEHGGIACLSGSSWISLVAPKGQGMLWNKRQFGPDVMLALKVEENTEWFGWSQYPTHSHYPFDNIRLSLAGKMSSEHGYTLEINSRNRSTTVLYRNGVEVAAVRQDERFPIHYHGGHAPYSPRRNSILLVKHGGLIEAYVNGQPVVRFNDPQPLEVSRVGFGGYNTRVNFTEVVVRQLLHSRGEKRP